MNSYQRGGRFLAAAAFSIALLSGCGSSDTPSAPVGQSSSPAATTTAATPSVANVADGRPKPATVRIPKIKAESSLVEVGLTKSRGIEVPPVETPMQAAWYKFSQVPGDPGPAILLGHVDGNQKPGIFYRLKELAVGDEILVDRKDGKTLRFVVHRTQQVPKEKLPEDAVYGQTTDPELRLITCGGVFDKAVHSYKDNVIVYAKLA
ncbi:sortase family protein [Herbihabitans rhizosphaerae]|uniref:Sortase family protein n=1 Tax=Herbihabitans rhizosphaerae TaxID=1872711 RepID=A0A4Q7L6L8_9PSEU|nr:class F sortase [Herbihabitans rhizosphaerae]RZS44906.1 sortase family protein [Herbihabitans rhizosphaerae]